jgi:hypothetical protein
MKPNPTFRLLGTVLTVAAILALPSLLSASEGSFDRSLPVTGAVDLEVTTGSGHIHVRTGGGGTVEVHAVIKARDHWGDPSAEEKVRQIEANPPIEQDGNTIRVGHISDPSLSRNVSIDYDLVVPAETRLHSETGSGDQSIEGIAGPLRASTGSGRIEAMRIGGEVMPAPDQAMFRSIRFKARWQPTPAVDPSAPSGWPASSPGKPGAATSASSSRDPAA